MASATTTKLVLSPLLVLLLLSVCNAAFADETGSSLTSSTEKNVFILDNYGDGNHDDTQALAKAWSAACSSSRPAVLLVPKGKSYLLKPVTLSGPCKSTVVFMVKGTLVAPPSRSDWTEDSIRHWIMFQGISDLTVTGGGAINGNGEIWWKNSCKTNESLPCTQAPTALTFHLCDNLKVDNLKIHYRNNNIRRRPKSTPTAIYRDRRRTSRGGQPLRPAVVHRFFPTATVGIPTPVGVGGAC